MKGRGLVEMKMCWIAQWGFRLEGGGMQYDGMSIKFTKL